MDKKKLLTFGGILLGLLAIGGILLIVFNKDTEEEYKIDGIDLPENKEVLKDTTVENLEIKNPAIIIRNEKSSFTASVKNTSDEKLKINKLTIVFYEGDNKIEAIALYNTQLLSGEITSIRVTVEKDLTKIDKIEYIVE